MTARRRAPSNPGRTWAYGGALLGGAVSVAANVAHSYVPPADIALPGGAAHWSPHAGAVIGAVFWPVALLVAVEIRARVDWPAARGWVLLRYAGLLPVAIVAAAVSYRHLSGLLGYYGEDALTARLGPLAVDGLMLVATGALIATSKATTPATAPMPVLAPPLDVVDVPAPAAATDDPAPAPEEPAPQSTSPGVPRPRTARPGGTGEAVAKLRARHPEMTAGQIAARLGISDRTVRRHLATTTGGQSDVGAMSAPAVGAGRHSRRQTSVNDNTNGTTTNGSSSGTTSSDKARGAATGLGTSPRPGSLTTTRATKESTS
jgi:hypothetical protein